ncbi:MAG TPA: universal stress protein [Edaphocola sp.]|nr:universal stress protein [Edaphocola sp.]
MAKRFIVLIDFSEYSSHLLQYVYAWSRREDAELLLLHQNLVIFPALVDAEVKQSIIRQANADALQQLKTLASDHISQCPKLSFVVNEKPLPTLLSELLSESYEHLIFLGLKGTGVLKKWFLGSVAVDVVETVSDIIVALPKDAPMTVPETLFVGVKEAHPLNVPALQKLLTHFCHLLPAIHFFTIAKPQDDRLTVERHLKSLVSRFSAQTMTTFSVYETGNTLDFIKEMIAHNPDVLMVIQKGSRMLKDHFMRQFLTNELVYDGKLPLVILP